MNKEFNEWWASLSEDAVHDATLMEIAFWAWAVSRRVAQQEEVQAKRSSRKRCHGDGQK